MVIEIAPDGAQALRYVQAGWIMALSEWKTPAGAFLAAGGVMNEREQASLVVIDPAQSLTAALGYPYVLVNEVTRLGERFTIGVGDQVVGVVQPDGIVSEWSFTDSYWHQHANLSTARRILHTAEMCPEITAPREIKTWTPATGWTSYLVPPKDRQGATRR